MGTNLTSWEDRLASTEQVCSSCGAPLKFTEEVYLLQVVQTYQANGTTHVQPLLDDDGDFLYEPHFLHFECWEEIEGNLQSHLRDVPSTVEDAASPIPCKCCKSGIREWESCGALTFGELHVSKRIPPGMLPGEDFVPLSSPDFICLYCLFVINENELEFWEDGVSQDGECEDCLLTRCVRYEGCDCACHHQEEEEEGTEEDEK